MKFEKYQYMQPTEVYAVRWVDDYSEQKTIVADMLKLICDDDVFYSTDFVFTFDYDEEDETYRIKIHVDYTQIDAGDYIVRFHNTIRGIPRSEFERAYKQAEEDEPHTRRPRRD